MTDPLIDAAVAAARAVPAEHVQRAATAIDPALGWSNAQHARLVAACPAGGFVGHIEQLSVAWRTQPELQGAAVAAALRAACRAVVCERQEHEVSLVWTGPSSEVVQLRSTRAVLHSLIDRAERSLLLVSYASTHVDDLVARLSRAVDRGVDVRLVLETREDSGGQLGVDAAEAFRAIRQRVLIYRWPRTHREASFSRSAKLHAKFVIADRSAALITSANLTGAGINDNIELGVLLAAGPLPGLLADHVDALVSAGALTTDAG